MELLHVVSEHSPIISGGVASRADVLSQNLWTLSTNIFIINSQGKLLCHQRSLKKERLPGVWITHMGGHVSHNEDFLSNALKEVSEEAGVEIKQDDIIEWRTTKIESAKLWSKDFVIYKDLDLSELIPQKEEVECFAWMTLEEILTNCKDSNVPWCAGIQDITREYWAMRAVLSSSHHFGKIVVDEKLQQWN